MKRCLAIVLAVLLPLIVLAQGNLVVFSKAGGFYEEPFTLSLQSENNFEIRYTTNGSTPTAESKLYERPLLLDEELYSKSDIYLVQTAIDEFFYAPESVQHCITLRAAAFDEEGNRVGPVTTQSYFFRSLGCDTHGLPVMSIAADSASLFDFDTGILVPGANFNPENSYWTGNFYESGMDWERLVNVEFYEPFDNSGINQQAGLRTHGGTSRRQLQKGMKIYARDEYGKKRFKHKFFKSLPNQSFKHLVLKPFSYHWFNYGIQDDICNHIAATLDVETIASRPMVLFLNGEYWGIYYLKEKPDAHYLEDHFDDSDDDFNVIDNWYGYQVDGDTTGFVAMMRWLEECDLTNEDDFNQLNAMVDVGCFIDYYCLELFIGNKDWPANNMRCYQHKDGRWRWIFFDGDDALHDLDFDVFDNATSLENLGWPTDRKSTLMFRKLLENDGFRDRFIARLSELLTTTFNYQMMKPFFDVAANQVRDEMPNQTARFGLPVSPQRWENDILTIDGFLRRRENDMRRRMVEYFGSGDNNFIFSSLYPNPSYGEVQLQVWSEDFSMCRLEVFDMMGRVVFSSKVMLRKGDNELKLPCHFASGLYMLRLGEQTKRFVIQ